MQTALDRPFQQDPLWLRLASHPIGGAAAPAFRHRLARENLWSISHADAVIAEYRRFCYLACVAGAELTPSDAVDQAWHLHLTHSRDYWVDFCPRILGRALHHGPGDGSSADAARFRQQYADTLALYAQLFGHPAPAAIWPPPAQRFQMAGVRIDAHAFLLVRKQSWPGRLLRMVTRLGR